MITNNANQVALKYHQPIQVKPEGYPYVFVPRASISLAWVDLDHAAPILAKRGGCNCGGGKKKQLFIYASEDDVRRWTNGGGR